MPHHLSDVHDVLLGSGNEALRVGILDAEDHRTAVLAGEQIVVKSGADAADVQRARGAGRETHPYFFSILFKVSV